MEERKFISNAKVLIVDEDRQIGNTLQMALESWGYECFKASNLAEASEALRKHEPQIVLLDIDLPDGSGLDFLPEIHDFQPDTIVVMITGNVSVDSTIAALRGGAHDFIGKPIHLEELRVTLRNAIETRSLRKEVKRVRRRSAEKFNFAQIIGESEAIRKAIDIAQKVASSDVSSVVLQGETGTGKDLFARAIHHSSERRDAPYLAINCAVLPANLIESELFGYEKGAFTDAKKRKEGLFEQAQGGTIFLDEIAEMDVTLQAKLLRVLEEGKFRRIGGLRELPLDVRVIAASNRDLKQESSDGNFRLDLYYRLSVIQIDIPPLRDRGDDVLLLAKYYIEKTNHKRSGDRKLKGLDKKTKDIFRLYEWTGNVRELRNIIERASVLEEGEMVTLEHLPGDLVRGREISELQSSTFVLPQEGIPLSQVELDLSRQALARTDGNLTKAAKLLEISRDQLRYRLNKGDKYEKKTRSAVSE